MAWTFYPEGLTQKRELKYASRALTTIEVNGTLTRRMISCFRSKCHAMRRIGVLELQDKLGPINWQFAPTKQFDPDDFGDFLKLLPAKVEGRAACRRSAA